MQNWGRRLCKADEARQCVTGSEDLQRDSERTLHETMKVKSKLQWRSQSIRDDRIIELCAKEGAMHGKEYTWEVMWVAGSWTGALRLPKSFGAQPISSHAPEDGLELQNLIFTILDLGFI